MPEEKLTVEELKKKAEKPGKDAMILHDFYKGKIQSIGKAPVRDFSDFAIWYTPGVAKPCLAIKEDEEAAYDHTNKGNMVAVVSDGTRVLGLGDIGPYGAGPVMEGKSILFKYLGGVDAWPVCVDTKDADKIIEVVKLIQPSFGGINLEDISKPKCYKVLEELRNDKDVKIPVWHDDAQGTATVVLAGVLGGLRVVKKEIESIKVALLGVGAANTRTAYLLFAAGVDAKNTVMVDSKGAIYADREDILEEKDHDFFKYDLAQKTNPERMTGNLGDVIEGVDVLISASRPVPGTVKKEWVSKMAPDSIVYACANPLPEIWPWDAKEGGARIVGTGRSDFDNQINNSLGFPGIFRGTLDVRASTITDEMCIAAAQALADLGARGASEKKVIPTMDQWELYPMEATAVGMKAIEQGIARVHWEEKDLYERAEHVIRVARASSETLYDKGYIPKAPPT
ncbi:MAG: NADP-dependent malic enzyme [Candidatus Thorarchaeota archaeon]|nr:MAG: NADP-dependent malic enzyme [Candidatus Thorarchaeota archaeon]